MSWKFSYMVNITQKVCTKDLTQDLPDFKINLPISPLHFSQCQLPIILNVFLPSTVNFSNVASEQENLHTVSQVESVFFFPPGGHL